MAKMAEKIIDKKKTPEGKIEGIIQHAKDFLNRPVADDPTSDKIIKGKKTIFFVRS